MTRRSKIIAAVAVAAVAIGGYAVYWWIVAGQLDQGIDAWAAQQRQAGLTLEFERSAVTGFPFDFQATFRHPHIAGVLGGQAFDWRGPDLKASVSPFDLKSLNLKGDGRHAIDLGQGSATVETADLMVRLGFGESGLLSSALVSFAYARLALPDHRTLAAGLGTASLNLPPAPPKADSDPLLRFVVLLADLRLPEGTTLLTADHLNDLQLAATVKGALPIAPLRQALASWRDAGGTVEVTNFTVSQATLKLAGSATVALDQNLQPIVAADVKARGLGPTIDLLASQKRIYPEDALKMKQFVKGAERDAPGGYKEVATGLTLQAGWLSWGPFKLAPVPPIEWP